MKIYVNTDYISKVFRAVHGFPKVKIGILDHAVQNTFERLLDQDHIISASSFADVIEFSASGNAVENRLKIDLATFDSNAIFPVHIIQDVMENAKKQNRFLPVLMEVTEEDLDSPEDYVILIASFSKNHPEENFICATINWRTLTANAQAIPDKNTHVFLYPIVIDLNNKIIGTVSPEGVQLRTYAKQEATDESSGE